MVGTEMFKDFITDGGNHHIRVKTEASGSLAWQVFLIFCTDEKERGVWVSFQYIEHNVQHGIDNGSRLECTGAKAEFVVTGRIRLVVEFHAVCVVDVSLNPYNIGVVRLGGLEAVLHRVFQQIVGTRAVVHLENERIAFVHHIAGS